jgi:hypothetical protein
MMGAARVILLLSAVTLIGAGCVRRTISITSEPPGALVWLNEREVGRTPVEVDFLYYGTYDVRLRKEGYEPLLTSGEANAPLWDTIPLDLAAEAVPNAHSKIAWHYVLEPLNDDESALLERAGAMRASAITEEQRPAENGAQGNVRAPAGVSTPAATP